jgi:hypothetical protein
MAWLRALTAKDLDISFHSGKHFAAVNEMTEEFRQEVQYQGAFGSDGPVLRRIRPADEGSVSFTAVLLRTGVAGRMNDEGLLRDMRDFEVQVSRGKTVRTYTGCNWNRISIRSTLDSVTLDCDISIPGYTPGDVVTAANEAAADIVSAAGTVVGAIGSLFGD